MLSGFPLVGIPVYSPSIFPRYLEFFLLNSLRLWEPIHAQYWTQQIGNISPLIRPLCCLNNYISVEVANIFYLSRKIIQKD